jgi:preprotein translocase subunit SecA
VGLRGYGGTDPLVEFKREAFKLYEELRGFIRHQVASTIFRVNVQVQPATPPPPRTLPMPTPQQMAQLRAAAAQRALAAQRAAAAQAAGATGVAVEAAANGSGPPAEADGALQLADDTDDVVEELVLEGDDLEVGPEDLAAVDEVADEDVLPVGAAPDPVAAQAVVAGLAASPRRMTLQHGDETVDTGVRTSASSGDPGAKLGRNDPCWCGSGMKFKKCHGR